MFYWALCASLGPPRWLCCWRISSPLCASLGTERCPMAPPQGAQPIIVCPVSGHAWRASGTRSNTERDCAVHPRRAAALAHRALVRRHLRRTRRGWATAHAPRGTLIRLPLAFLSGFVHLFVAEHVRRRWFLGVLVYLPAHFVNQTAYSASRARAC